MTPTDLAYRLPPASLPDDVVPLVPMRNLVLFPQVLAPVTIGRPRSVAAVAQAAATRGPLAVVLQKNPEQDDPGLDEHVAQGAPVLPVRRELREPPPVLRLLVVHLGAVEGRVR